MSKFTNLKLVLFFIGLTILLTIIVVYAWEKVLMSPLYTYVGASPAGRAQSPLNKGAVCIKSNVGESTQISISLPTEG